MNFHEAVTNWHQANRCTHDDHDNCVEVGTIDGRTVIRDTKHAGRPSASRSAIAISPETFAAFAADIAAR